MTEKTMMLSVLAICANTWFVSVGDQRHYTENVSRMIAGFFLVGIAMVIAFT